MRMSRQGTRVSRKGTPAARRNEASGGRCSNTGVGESGCSRSKHGDCGKYWELTVNGVFLKREPIWDKFDADFWMLMLAAQIHGERMGQIEINARESCDTACKKKAEEAVVVTTRMLLPVEHEMKDKKEKLAASYPCMMMRSVWLFGEGEAFQSNESRTE
jgi:hypothetical protein